MIKTIGIWACQPSSVTLCMLCLFVVIVSLVCFNSRHPRPPNCGALPILEPSLVANEQQTPIFHNNNNNISKRFNAHK